MAKGTKPDLMENPTGIQKLLMKLKEEEGDKIPVRINNKTIVLLSQEKNNKNYVTKLKNKFNNY